MDALPELPDDVQGGLAIRVPGLLDADPLEVRARLLALGEALGVDLGVAGRLVAKVRDVFAAFAAVGHTQITLRPARQFACEFLKLNATAQLDGMHPATRKETAAGCCCARKPVPPPPLLRQVPALWNRSPEAAAAKLSGFASALGVDVPAAAALLMGAPQLAGVNAPTIVAERVEAVGDALGLATRQVLMVSVPVCPSTGPLTPAAPSPPPAPAAPYPPPPPPPAHVLLHAQAALSLGRQPMLWVVGSSDVRSPAPVLAERLGLTMADAATLLERMPVLLAYQPDWLCLK